MIRIFSNLFRLSIVLAVLLNSCHSSPEKKGIAEMNPGDLNGTDASKEIVITREQFEASDMKLGNSEIVTFTEIVKGSGYISAAPGGIARISILLPGKINEIYIQPGTHVKKGERLFYMEGNELISLQQEYASSSHSLVMLKSTYERQQILAEENISARKELIRAENEYLSMLARTEGLKAQLKILHLDTEKVRAGNIASGVTIISPIEGYVTEMDLILGQVIESHQTVVEIINPDQLQLNIHVYENDLDELKLGQKVMFYKPEQPNQKYQAALKSIGQAVNEKDRTIHCLASLHVQGNGRFIHGLFVETEIITCEREAEAISEQALIEENDRYYILEKTGERNEAMVFRKRLVDLGVIMQGYAELTGESLRDVLIEGSYNIGGE